MVKVTYLVAKGDVYKVVINTWVGMTNVYQLDNEKIKSGVVSYLNNSRPVYRSVIDTSYVLEEDKTLSEKEVDDLVAMDEIFKIKVIMDFKYGEGTEVEEFEDIKGVQEYMINYQSNNVGEKKWTFDDIVLNPEVEREVKKTIEVLKHNDRIMKIGSKPTKGIIMEGRPGTGKTTIAKIIASELDCKFISRTGSSFAELYVGSGAKNVRDMFSEIEGKTCVFIDECESLFGKRGDSKENKEREATLNEFLAAMSGFDNKPDVFFIAATNRLDMIDEAVLRGGRFEKSITVDYPDLEGIGKVFKLYLDKMITEGEIDYMELADRLGITSPANVEYICNETGLYCVLEKDKDFIEQEDVVVVIDRYLHKGEEREEKPSRPIGFTFNGGDE